MNTMRGLLVTDLKTGETRSALMRTDFPLMDMGHTMEVITVMVRKYVSKNNDLTDEELIHFHNWTMMYIRHCPDIDSQKQHQLQAQAVDMNATEDNVRRWHSELQKMLED